jgi:isopentenyl-diphosphate delta-isomerase
MVMSEPASAAGGADRERLVVELVDHAGTATGSCTVAEAHTPPGRTHRAFSLVLFGRDGLVLLQQRAEAKTRFPLRWSNTCCGHPAPGQEVAAAAVARLAGELGIGAGQITHLAEVGAFHYHADDLATGRVEDEWDHVLVASLSPASGVIAPDEREVHACRWAEPGSLLADIAARPGSYTPWLSAVLTIAAGRRPSPHEGGS